VAGVGAGVVALLVVLAVVLGGGDGAPAPGPEAAEEADGATADGAPGAVASVLEEMSTAEKVGQLMLVGPNGTDSKGAVFAAIEERGYGGILIGPTDYESPDQASDLARAAAAAARRGDGVEPWVMAPQPGGAYSALAGLPPEKAPGRIGSPSDAAEAAADSARELRDAGVNGVLAPALDVAPFAGGEIGDLAYSDDEDEVSNYATKTVRAYAKEDMFAAPGRFPGIGAASQTTEEGPVNVGLGLAELRERDLRPFQAAIEAGAPGMVIGPGIYQTGDFVTPASLSPTIVTKLLRERLGFKGVAIADDLTSPAVTSTVAPADAAVESVKAGVDLVYVSRDAEVQEAVYEALLKAAEKGTIEAERLDEAATRSLAAKRRAGLLETEGDGGGGSGGGSDGE
jgi:beta-N-acetylhexosaminidase